MFILENSGIYKIINKINGKYYPGSSCHLLKQKASKNSRYINGRKWEHFFHLKRGDHHCQYLQRAYNKYGKENFEFVIIKNNIPKDQLLIEEQNLLDIAKKEPEMCYTKNYIAGRVEPTPERNKKISEKLKFITRTKETRAKIKDSWKIRKFNGYISPFKGKKLTEEQKLAIRERSIKPIKQLDLNNNLIKIWDSIIDASNFINRDVSSIIDALKGRSKTCAGFKWEYLSNMERIENLFFEEVNNRFNKEPLDKDDVEFSDSIAEIIEKIIINSIRTWKMEDAISKTEDPIKVTDLKRKIDFCFKNRRPKLIKVLNLILDEYISKNKPFTEQNVKMYSGYENK